MAKIIRKKIGEMKFSLFSPEQIKKLSCAKIVTPELYDIDRYRDWETDRKSTRLNSSHSAKSRMPSSA